MSSSSEVKVQALPIYDDNYIWVLRHPTEAKVIAVDPGRSADVVEYCERNKVLLWGVFVTHSHWDHVTGLPDLKAAKALWCEGNVQIFGPSCIEEVNKPVGDGDTIVPWGDYRLAAFDVMATPGHMPEHLVYVQSEAQPSLLFCGDTLFSCGCGRIFKGTHKELMESLDKLASLDDDTVVYCTHEYTLANMAFAEAVEPENTALMSHQAWVTRVRTEGKPSLPSSIGLEKQINPFLRYRELSVRRAVETQLDQPITNPIDTFKQLRLWKDRF